MSTYINPEEPQWPVTQGFGQFPGGFNPAGGHTGRDKGTPIGRPLRAPAAGTITLAGNAGPWNTNDYWLEGAFAGQSVVLDTDDGQYAFTFNHLSRILVRVGQHVEQGEIIVESGNSGGATSGAHHHFEVMPNGWNFQNGTYGRINPDTVCKGYFDGTQGQPTLPNHRKNGPQVTNQRADSNVSAEIIRQIPADQLEVWEGYVHGQEVSINGFVSDIWFKDKVGYAWCGGFTSQSTDGLPDLTPRAQLAANQRLAGPAGVRQRAKADTSGDVVREIPGGSVEVFIGFVHGQNVTVGDITSDIWFVDAKGFAWSGGFESQSVVGLPDLTVSAPPAPAPEPAVPAPTFLYLNGIDVAKYQARAALNTVLSDFYIIKATEGGADYTDEALASNVAEARLTGKPIGFYHFARPLATAENTAAEEARSFLKAIKPFLQVGDLVFLDWEAENQSRTDWALEWLKIVAKATGAKPLIYLNAAAINGGDWSEVEKLFGLWYAGYGANPVREGFQPPATMPDVTWAAGLKMYQYSSKTRLPNYDGDLDVNVFYGTVEEFKALGATTLLQEPVPNPPVCEIPPAVTDDPTDTLREFTEWLIDGFKNRKKD